MRKVRYNGIVGETMEELGDIVNYAFGFETLGAEDLEGFLDRMTAYVKQAPENVVRNFLAFAVLPVAAGLRVPPILLQHGNVPKNKSEL